MKKPKFPIGLVVVLLLLVGGIVALNAFTARNTPHSADDGHDHGH